MTERASTQILVPRELVVRLRSLSHQTRVTQADYLREAIEDLLKKHAGRTEPVRGEGGDGYAGVLDPVVFRIETDARRRLRELAGVTRVRVSEYVREGIADLLAKHAAQGVSR
jgi:predicted DNA-binding protein